MTPKAHRRSALFIVCVYTGLLLILPALAQSAQAKPATKANTNEAAADEFDTMDSLLDFSALPAAKTGEQSTEDKVKDLAKASMAVRDPFWPVGFKPKPKDPEEEPTKPGEKPKPKPKPVDKPRWEEAARTLSIKGIMSAGGGEYMAMINGNVAGEGDQVSTVYRGRKYSWKVDTISDSGVTFQKIENKSPTKPKKPEIEIVE